MSTSGTHPMSFTEFRALIARELQLDPAQITPEASFVEDLMVDSIRMVDLMLRLEELGISFPLEAAWDIRTVQDAYECYLKHNAPGLTTAREVTAG